MQKNLKIKMLVFVLICMIIPVALVGIFSVIRGAGTIEEQAQEDLNNEATIVQNQTLNYMEENENVIKTIGAYYEDNWQQEEVYEGFNTFLRTNDQFLYFYVGDELGEMTIVPDTDLGEDFDPRERPWYEGAYESQDLFVTEPYIDAGSGNPVVTIAVPVEGTDITRILGGDIELTRLSEVVADMDIRAGGTAYIVDEEGELLAHPELDLETEGDYMLENREYVADLAQGESGFFQDGEYVAQGIHLDDYGWSVVIEAEEQYIFGEANTIRTNMILIPLILILIFGIVVYRYVSKQVATPLVNLTDIIDKLARFDFTFDDQHASVKYLQRKDEIGQITTSISKMQGNIVELLKSIQDKSEQLAASSQEMNSNSEQNTEAANEVAKAIEDISSGAENQAEDVEKASNQMEEFGQLIETDQEYLQEANQHINEVDNLKEQGVETIEELTSRTKENNNAIREIRDVINETSDSAQKIEKASDMIKDIAEQTNLLALNANIEAARAGEAGKGFAVVADEIRKLAEESNEYSEEISNIISELTTKTSHAVQKMESAQELITQQSQSVTATRDQFNGIAEAIQSSQEMIAQLNETGEQMESKKQEFVEKLQSLSAIAQENSSSTEQASASVEEQTASMDDIAKASDSLAQLAEQMQEEVNKFKY